MPKNKYPGEKLRPSETDWIFNLSPNLAYLKIDDLTQEVYDRVAGEERKRAFIEGMDRVQPPQLEYIKKNILPEIKDNNLRETLLNEAEHPFPCFITFEGVGKDDKLYQNIYNKKPTVVPFEDFYLDAFYGNDIREIRVPENKIDQVKKWLDEKDLKHIKLVPLEVYEIKRIIEDNIDESLEQTLEQDYPFLAERKSKLQGIVHYDETFLEHMKNCLDELSGMEEEFRETFDNPAKQRKYLAIIKKVLILHEIGKLVTSEELEQMGFNISAKNEQDGAEVILAKYDQLNIHDKNEAQLISFLVRSYHDFFDIYINQKQSLETQEEVLNFSREQQISPSDLLQLMRFVANANNLSAVETTNRNTDSNHTKEQLKDILNTVVDKMLIEIQKAE
ncbi:MAG: hypothetical protein WCJ74_02585 [bacterium]